MSLSNSVSKKRKKASGVKSSGSTVAKTTNSAHQAESKVPKTLNKSNCSRCNSRRKCFRHLNQRFSKSSGVLSCKASEQTVLQLKKHMLKLVSGDPGPVCKANSRTNVLNLDCSKMYKLYLQEYEPQAINSISGELSSGYKPSVKQWLYRKILLDEFQGLDFLRCKQHLADLKQAVEEASFSKSHPTTNNKKRKKLKSLKQNCASSLSSPAVSVATPVPSSQLHASTLSPYVTAQVTPNLLLGLSGQQPCPTQPLGVHLPCGTQNLPGHQPCSPQSLSLQQPCANQSLTGQQTCTPQPLNGQLNCSAQQTLGCQKSGSAMQPPLPFSHPPSLATANAQQQQPLNLQRPQAHLQHHASDNQCGTTMTNDLNSSNSLALPLCQPMTSCGTIPLGLHSPYYVSLSPMLPLHMSQASTGSPHHFHHHIAAHPHSAYPPHHHQQNFQHDVTQHPHSLLPGGAPSLVNNHSVYH
ncbi:hypothetical protein FHG87_015644 [Trinorchestia longiramus]|nr:hypothetical protein FHG87_015644 [Trinorchestia longiramus]